MSENNSKPRREKKKPKETRAEEKSDVFIMIGEEPQIKKTTTGNEQEAVVKRINALKVLYKKFLENDCKYYQEILLLEHKYDKVSKEIHEKRRKILNGEYEPTVEESNYPSDEEETDENKHKKIVNYPSYDENIKGIPKFWLTVLKNVPIIRDEIHDYDEPVLSHLQDIKLKLHESSMGYTLEFHFSENEYFTNKVLTKHYEVGVLSWKGKLASLNGPCVIDSKRCKIDWKEGEDLTQSEYFKKNLSSKNVDGSFFEFFNPLMLPNLSGVAQHMFQKVLMKNDFAVGQYYKLFIIPKAIGFYTGEGLRNDHKDKMA